MQAPHSSIHQGEVFVIELLVECMDSNSPSSFCNLYDNVKFVHALVKEMQSRDHGVFLVEKNPTQVCKMLDAMILGEEITKRKSGGEKMKKQDKISYMKEWKTANMNMLIACGLDLVTQGPNKSTFALEFTFLHQLQGQQFHTYSKSPTLMQLT